MNSLRKNGTHHLRVCALAFSVAVLLLTSAGAQQSSPPRAKTLMLTDKDNGKIVHVRVGQGVVVRLKANPSTGYSWAMSADPPALSLSTSQFSPDAKTNGRAGAGGTQVFTFAAVSTVAGKLELEYRRPWEKNTPPARTFVVDIEIVP